MQHQKILILDFGSQVTQLIARRLRETHVYCEIHPYDVGDAFIREFAPKGIVLSGSHASTYEEHELCAPQAVWDSGVPVLGICYGMFTMTVQQGGQVEASAQREFGYAEVRAHGHTRLLDSIEDFATPEGHGMLKVWMSHGDKVVEMPAGFKLMASTDACPIAGMADEARRFYAVQFHPEVTHTAQGTKLLHRFVRGISGCRGDWNMPDYVLESVGKIKNSVKHDEVILGLSGGVDSSVAAALIHKAIGKQLTCVFVDHGLNREGEPQQVEETFGRHFGVPLVHVKAEDRFLAKLAGVTDPERKRRAIGEEFIRVFEEVAREHRGAHFLVQGTLYPDVIESGSRTAANIKSHHNVGGLPEDMELELVEPLRDLFKDEVRKVGAELGLPEEVVQRQPFPGPGLAVRIVGEVTAENLDKVRGADRVVREEIRRAGLERETWQAFCVLLADTKTVGVMGDGRTYESPVIVRVVTSEDAMTADWARLPYDVLDRIAARIVREVPGVNRVAYDITSKPPGTIEWE